MRRFSSRLLALLLVAVSWLPGVAQTQSISFPEILVNGESVFRLVSGQPFKFRITTSGILDPNGGFSVYRWDSQDDYDIFQMYEAAPLDTTTRVYPLAASERSSDALPQDDFIVVNEVGWRYFSTCLQSGGRLIEQAIKSTCRAYISFEFQEDTQPTAGAAPAAQIWIVGVPVDLTLPEATGGNISLDYAMTPALPAGLSFNPETRTITGTPTQSSANMTYTMTATDFDGDTAELMFEGVVVTAGITVADLPTSVDEGSDTGAYTVALDTVPTDNVTVTPAAAGDNGQVSFGPAEVPPGGNAGLTFTATDWNTAQTVSIMVGTDINIIDETVTLSHAVSGAAEYAAVIPPTNTFEIVDDGVRATVVISETTLTVDQSGAESTDIYTVVLSTNPGAGASVTVTPSSDNDDVTVSAGVPPGGNAGLTFSDSDWNTAQTVTVTGSQDTTEDYANDTATISHAVANYGTVSDADPVIVTVTDPDIAPGITLSKTALSLTEGGAGDTYTVALASDPGAGENVTVTLSMPDAVPPGTGLTIEPSAALVFTGDTTGTWNTPQTVTVTALQDTIEDFTGGSVDIAHTVSGATTGNPYDGLAVTHLPVTITDPDTDSAPDFGTDTQGDVSYTVGDTVDLTLPEATGGNGELTYTLTPQGDIPAGLAFDATTRVLSGTPATAGTVTLTYTAADADANTTPADTAAHTFEFTITAPAGVTVDPQALTINQEGASGEYTVVLNTNPGAGASVTVTLSSDNPEVTMSPSAPLVFTSTTWDTAQTVTVTGSQDTTEDYANDTATISHAVTNYGAVTDADPVIVTVTDPDIAPGITVAGLSGTVDEGDSNTYTVALNTAPSDNVTVTPGVTGDNGQVTLPASLVFSTGNWDTAQSVTLMVGTDINADDETVTLSHALSGAAEYAALPTPTNTFEIIDDGVLRAAVVLSESALSIDEGAEATYEVRLNSDPGASEIVTVTLTMPAAMTIAPSAALVFTGDTTGTWSTPQTVTVTALQDTTEDFTGGSVDIAHAVSGATIGNPYDGLAVTHLPVTITDPDTDSAPDFGTDTQGDVSYTVGDTVDLTLPEATDGNGELTYTLTPQGDIPAGLAFDATTRVLSGTPTTTGTVTLTYTAADADANTTPADTAAHTFEVTITAPAGVTVDPQALTIDQEGASGEYTVALDTAPSGGDVTVTPSSNNPEVTVSPSAPLVFTSTTWNSAQTITVTGAQDTTEDYANDTATISHAVANYGTVSDADPVIVTVTDPDIAPGITLSETDLSLTEGGASDTYTVALTTDPGAGENVTVTLSMPAAVTIEPSAALVFTGDTTGTWNTPQTVTVTALQDAIEDFTGGSVDIAHAVSGATIGNPYDGLAATHLPVTITDPDTDTAPDFGTATQGDVLYAVGATVDMTLPEATGGNGELTYTLTPQGDIPAGLAFDATTRVLSGTPTPAGTVTLTYTAADADANTTPADTATLTFEVTITAPAGVTVDPQVLTIDQEGASGEYTVALDTAPSGGDVTVTPSSDNTDVTVSPSAPLVFTSTTWDTAQTVTVTGAQDTTEDYANDTATISHAVTGYGAVSDADPVIVTVTDRDIAPGITVAGLSGTVDEGDSNTYTVALNTAPSDSVTVTPGVTGDNGQVTLPASLVFTTGSWNTAQSVTLAVGTDINADDETVTLSHALSGAAEYAALPTPTNTFEIDDDGVLRAAVVLSESALSIDEGAEATYEVRLNSDPGASEIVTVTLSMPDAVPPGTGLTIEPTAALVFTGDTTGTWSTPQTVTVTALQDTTEDFTGDSVDIVHTVSGATTGNPYDGLAAIHLPVTITDPDTDSVPDFGTDTQGDVSYTVGDTVDLTLPEATGGNGELTYTLTPQGDIPAGLAFDATTRVLSGTPTTAGTATLTYTAADADANTTPADTAAHTFEFTITAPAGVTVDPQALTIDQEGASASGEYTVALDTVPSGGDVTVTPSSDNPEVTVSPAMLTFTATDWNTAQTITVTGAQDTTEDYANDTATISHAVANYGTVSDADPVIVTVTDRDIAPGITLSETALSLTEGGASDTYTVALATDPGAGENVTVTLSMPAAVTIEPSAALVFTGDTTGTWNIPQTVTVTALQDTIEDFTGGSVDIAHAVSGATTGNPYDGLAATDLPVTIIDNEADTAPDFGDATQGDEFCPVDETVDLTLPEATGGNGDLTYALTPDITTMVPGLTFTATTRVLSGHPTTMVAAVMLTYTAVDADANTDPADTAAQTFEVTITAAAGVTVDPQALTIDQEGAGASGEYTVVLNTNPGAGASVTVTPSSDNDDVTVSAGVPPGGNAGLTFSDSTWNTAQTVTVTGSQDDPAAEDYANDTATISHAVANYGTVTDADPVIVTVTDRDIAPGITLSKTELSLTEGGAGDTYTVALVTDPGAGEVVTVTLTMPDAVPPGTGLTIEPSAALVFTGDTTGTWNTPQTVTVTALQDAIEDFTGGSVDIAHTVSGATIGNPYDGLAVTHLPVTITDPDTDSAPDFGTDTQGDVSYTVGDTVDLTLPEATGGNGELTYTLTPQGDIPAGLAFDATTRVLSGTPTTTGTVTLTYTAADADANTTPADTAAHTFEVTITAPAGVTVDPQALTIDQEGASGEYTVALDTAPSGGDVTVTPSSNNDDVTVSAALTFSDSTWNTAQTVTVIGSQDDPATEDYANDTATISHAVSGYGAITDADPVIVTVTDPDIAPGITLSETALSLTEGGASDTYTVALATDPGAGEMVTVTLSMPEAVPPGTGLTIEPSAALVFTGDTTGTWSTPQTVTVTALQDAIEDFTGGSVDIAHAVSGANIGNPYDGLAATHLPVTIIDNEADTAPDFGDATQGDEFCPVDETVDMTLPEATGGNGDLTYALTPDITTMVPGLTFTATTRVLSGHPTTMVAAVMLTYTAVDADANTKPADTAAQTFEVTITAPEATAVAGVTVGPQALTIDEEGAGASGEYTVALDTAPSGGDVTVTPSSGNPEVTVSPAMLTFTDSTWDTAQTVTVTGSQDDPAAEDYTNDTATISHAVSGYGTVTDADPVIVTVTDLDRAPVDIAGLDSVNQIILPEVARALAGQQTDAIAKRVREAGESCDGGGGDAHFNLGGQTSMSTMAARHAQTLANDDLDMKRILGDTDFVIPMGGAVSGLAGGTGDPCASAALWGAGDYRSLGDESSDGNSKWDGDLFGAHLGFDAHLRPDLLAGLMVSYSEADIDYKHPNSTAGGDEQKGDYELEMTSINPYIGWSALNGQLDIWATIGYGSGDLEVTPDNDNLESLSSDVTMSNIGLGGSGLIRKNRDNELRVNAEAFHTRAEIDGADRNAAQSNTPELWDLDVDATRLRLMLESRHPRTTATGARLTPSAEIGMRQDSGDGRTGTGAEIGGGIHYNDAQRGLSLEANARALLAHSGDYDDWGISGKIRLQPGADGQGLSLSLTPAYGKTAAATENIWNNGSLDTTKATTNNGDDNLKATLEARLAYGLNLTSGLLTPYTEMTWGEESQTYRLGLQWDITQSLNLNLVGEQKANNNSILLKGEISF